MTTAKNKVFIGLLLENFYLVGEMNFWCGGIETWWGGSLTRREFFLVGGWADFRLVSGLPQVQKTLLSLT